MSTNRQLIDLKKWRPQKELYIALLDLDFSWYPDEVEQVEKSWRNGLHIIDIAKQVGRDTDEVAILLMDLVRRKRIKKRWGGAYGTEHKHK